MLGHALKTLGAHDVAHLPLDARLEQCQLSPRLRAS
jgi:hypothetical protein